MKSRVVLNGVALVTALIAGALVFGYAKSADSRAIDRQSPEPVVVSLQEIPAGTSLADAINQGLASQTSVAKQSKPVGSIDRVTADNGALVALTTVPAGQYLLDGNFGVAVTQVGPLMVPDGQIAVTVALRDPPHVASFVVPGSDIVVFDTATIKDALGNESASTRIILDRIRVLAINAATATERESTSTQTQGSTSEDELVTVAVTQRQAEVLVHAAQTGQLYFGLLNHETSISKPRIITDKSLF